eukprot:2626440-Rhodomonas_salina.1
MGLVGRRPGKLAARRWPAGARGHCRRAHPHGRHGVCPRHSGRISRGGRATLSAAARCAPAARGPRRTRGRDHAENPPPDRRRGRRPG